MLVQNVATFILGIMSGSQAGNVANIIRKFSKSVHAGKKRDLPVYIPM
jgi:hypothetical protein